MKFAQIAAGLKLHLVYEAGETWQGTDYNTCPCCKDNWQNCPNCTGEES